MNVEITGDTVITIRDAYHLMDILKNDIPEWQKSKIALLLLILAANPKMVEQGNVVTDKYSQRSHYYSGRDDWWGYEGY